MNIAQHLALIDELCHRPFPAENGPSDVGVSGPGHHVAVLEAADDDEPATRAVTIDQYEKDRDAVYEHLASRWGDTPPYNLQTVLLRTAREEIPAPWVELSARAGVAHLWEVEGTGRWVAVAVADRDASREVQLLALVTEADPP
ncbi:hypothetical protein [Streptomyces sp. FXY-T5]|uniref:hypothetical protein n=1 Tax=Streptomyces sp. FXY-T5 TaxID=3064901 RepID=UPI0027D31FF0|nr:hypothetical protein [Streptomyces sp. FXY-T5]WMD07359.1 hypothetical protein Q7C01_24640 [Streptomyces sp. FXY-T5]